LKSPLLLGLRFQNGTQDWHAERKKSRMISFFFKRGNLPDSPRNQSYYQIFLEKWPETFLDI
jgi:hypothetical protein